jgi:copper(I)-binding protein
MNRLLTLAAALLLAAPAFAHETVVGDLEIIHAHIPAPAPNAMAAGGFMAISNIGAEPDTLIGITCDFAEMSHLHETKVDANGVGSMQPVEALEIPAGETVVLDHGSYHFMFMGLKESLVDGQMVKATLVFEKAGPVEIEFMVEADDGMADDHEAAD